MPEGEPDIALVDLIRRAEELQVRILANQVPFDDLLKDINTLEGNFSFQDGTFSAQCRALKGRVQILSTARDEQKNEKAVLASAYAEYLRNYYQPNHGDEERIQRFQQLMAADDHLDDFKRLRQGTCEPTCEGVRESTLQCLLAHFCWMTICCCNKRLCGVSKLEDLKSRINKGIR